MAYLREESEKVEVDYPIRALWDNIPKAVAKLEWAIEESDEDKHHIELKTKGAFLSYGSKMKVDLVAVDEETTRMLISAETPVTTITSMADFGRTRDRVEQFIVTLAKLMENKSKSD
jgi:pyruvate-formate lyase